MFNKVTLEAYCCEPAERIQGYAEAASSPKTYDCHHRFEEMGLSRQDLKEIGLYYKRPACELVLMLSSEHHKLHTRIIPTDTNIKGRFQKGRVPVFTELHRQRISEAKKGIKRSPEHTAHLIEAQRAFRASAAFRDSTRQRMVQRFADPEKRQQQSACISKLWEDEAYRQAHSASLRKASQADAEAYKAYKASGGELSWKAWRSKFSPYNLYRAAGGTLSHSAWFHHGKPAHD